MNVEEGHVGGFVHVAPRDGGCGVRNGPRGAAHPEAVLEVFVPVFAKTFLRFR